MKRFLNTLFVTTQKMYLKKEGETVAACLGKVTKLQLPLINLSGIVCFGNIRVSPWLMGHCAQKGVSMTFLTEYGKFLARVQGPVAGNVLLRKAQYRMSDHPERSSEIAKSIISGKLANCRTVIQRAIRDHPDKADTEKLQITVNELGRTLNRLKEDNKLDILRGMEGESSRVYFSAFNDLITSQKEDFCFTKRSRRPPLDKVNALLSFVYTLLYHDMRSALESVGLDPAVGFLHRDRPGRLSLALDLMEEFRPFFADRLVLSLINLKQVEGRNFKVLENGAVQMDDKARRAVLEAYQKRKQDAVTHPFINEKMHIGILFHIQALLLARYIRGDLDAYPPYFWR